MKLLTIKLFFAFTLLSFNSFMVAQPVNIATFKAIKIVSYNDTNLIAEGYSALANIFETPTMIGLRPYKGVNDGNVSLNSVSLGFNNIINMYVDNVQRTSFTIYNSLAKNSAVNTNTLLTNDSSFTYIYWSLKNATQHTNFDFNTTKTIPSLIDITSIPNTISLSNDFVLNLGNIPNVDKVEFNIDNEQVLMEMPYYKKMPANSANITILKNDLGILNTNNLTSIRLTLINEEQQTYNNQTYTFENRLEIIKYVTVIN